jgi:hypothetical protein
VSRERDIRRRSDGPAQVPDEHDPIADLRLRLALNRRIIQRKAERDAEAGAPVSQPGDPAEQEADHVADGVADSLHGAAGAEAGAEASPAEVEEARQLAQGEEAEPAAEEAPTGAAVEQAAPPIAAKADPNAIHLSPDDGRTGGIPMGGGFSSKQRGQQAEQRAAEKQAPVPPDQKRPAEGMTNAAMKDVKARLLAGDRSFTREEIDAFNRGARIEKKRDRGVGDFWALERQRLRNGQPGTRNWTPEQRADILAGKVPKGPDGNPMEGHHMFGVKDFPQVAGTGANIHPATRKEHKDRWHGGDTKADTDGMPRRPDVAEEF